MFFWGGNVEEAPTFEQTEEVFYKKRQKKYPHMVPKRIPNVVHSCTNVSILNYPPHAMPE